MRAPGAHDFDATREILRAHRLITVCEEAACPNIGECWGKRHATFMIMGDTCTRACAFCNVRTGQARRARCRRAGARGQRRRRARSRPCGGDLGRPRRSRRRRRRAFRRDHSRHPRGARPTTSIEVLTPDFLRKDGALEIVRRSRARRVQPQCRDRALALPAHSPGRRLSPFARAARPRQGARARASSPSRASWSASARRRTKCSR